MNQGKLEVVKQEMATVNVDILGISELKWTGMGEFNSDDHYIHPLRCQDSRREMIVYQALQIYILEISELKWTGMGEFNSDEHYIYYCGQESLRRNKVALTINKRV